MTTMLGTKMTKREKAERYLKAAVSAETAGDLEKRDRLFDKALAHENDAIAEEAGVIFKAA